MLTVQYSQHGPRISQFAPAIRLAESFRLSGKSPAKKMSVKGIKASTEFRAKHYMC